MSDDIPIRDLNDIWRQQSSLNAKAGIDTAELGRRLRLAEESGDPAALAEIKLTVGRWIKNYLDALSAECHELQETLYWKHWYAEARAGRQHELNDIQNARVEVTDMLFFWVSLCQLLGLEVEDVLRLYAKKLTINHRRQDQQRTQAEHADHEHENRNVT
ncbi:MAG: hypothetical protein BIFFINMI_00094 [Phycisphaerae bacterium]|nr:hypothetical protein [Phycisphaerae bacterium]